MTWDYVSAFLDTDGSICLTRSSKDTEPTLQIAFHNSYIELINVLKDFIYKETGIPGSVSKKKSKSPNHLDSYDLKYIGARRALKLSKYLNLRHPVKSKKLAIAEKLVELTPRNGKYTEKLLNERDILIKQFHDYNSNFH